MSVDIKYGESKRDAKGTQRIIAQVLFIFTRLQIVNVDMANWISLSLAKEFIPNAIARLLYIGIYRKNHLCDNIQ